MKSRLLSIPAAAGALAIFALAVPVPASGQNNGAPAVDAELEVALAELTAQNAQLAKNQAEIEAKIARLTELVRQARIYSARGGKAKP